MIFPIVSELLDKSVWTVGVLPHFPPPTTPRTVTGKTGGEGAGAKHEEGNGTVPQHTLQHNRLLYPSFFPPTLRQPLSTLTNPPLQYSHTTTPSNVSPFRNTNIPPLLPIPTISPIHTLPLILPRPLPLGGSKMHEATPLHTSNPSPGPSTFYIVQHFFKPGQVHGILYLQT